MNKIFNPATLVIAILVSAVYSCTERLNIKTKNADPTVSVYCELSTDTKIQTVAVKMTAPYFSAEPNKPITNAIVTISGAGESWVLDHTENGIYATTYEAAAKPGYAYKLSVECDYDNDGIADLFTASTTVPEKLPIDKIEFKTVSVGAFTMYNCVLYTFVPQGYRYAMYRYDINDSLYMTELSDTRIVDIKFWLSKDYIDGLVCDMFHSKDDMHHFDDDQLERIYFVGKDDKVTIQMSMIDKGFYDFLSHCQTEIGGENPIFGGPASNITTNISNGGVGYFSAINPARATTVIDK